jgi:tetratricopeptide (TPR) repeat protein
MPLDVDRPRRARGVRYATSVLAALLVLAPVIAIAADGVSAGVLLRRARYALAESRRQDAADALRAVRAAEPRSPRGLEAALLLADLQLKSGDAAQADRTLGDAERDFPDGANGAELVLARGWLGLARGDASSALRHFARVATRTDERATRELAALGSGWARLLAATGKPEVPAELVTLAASAEDPLLRAGALLSLAETHGARGEPRRALRALRKLRRLARQTSFADDVELAIGLVQLDMGRPAAARRTLAPIATDTPTEASARRTDAPGLTLADLRLPPRAFAARLATLYAGQAQPEIDLRRFLGSTLDRPAGRDAATALDRADAALAARKDA